MRFVSSMLLFKIHLCSLWLDLMAELSWCYPSFLFCNSIPIIKRLLFFIHRFETHFNVSSLCAFILIQTWEYSLIFFKKKLIGTFENDISCDLSTLTSSLSLACYWSFVFRELILMPHFILSFVIETKRCLRMAQFVQKYQRQSFFQCNMFS